MLTFLSPEQRLHHPRTYYSRGRMRTPQETPDRIDALLEGVVAMGFDVRAPADVGMAPLLAVQDADYLRFLGLACARRRVRCRRPPRPGRAGDLLRARRRLLRVDPRRPDQLLSGGRGLRRRDRSRRRAGLGWAGLGCNLNLPMPHGSPESVFFERLDEAMAAIRGWRPDALVFALGFDIYAEDPQTQVAVSSEGFRRLGRAVASLGLPTVYVQEGGYHIGTLARNAQQFFAGVLDGRG